MRDWDNARCREIESNAMRIVDNCGVVVGDLDRTVYNEGAALATPS